MIMITIIAAIDSNRALGFQGNLLFRLPNDMKRFRLLTTGHTVIMGRKTFESLPKGALPNRTNFIVSSSISQLPGCQVFKSLTEAISASDGDVYIIGGASIYEQAMPFADKLCLTEVKAVAPQADCFFPSYREGWREVWRESHPSDDRHAQSYDFADYVRIT